jgi:fibronectin-binding autotransporter adhesin
MVSNNGQNLVDRISSAAITVNGGGGLWWENTTGANSFAETVGSATVNSGLFNINLTTNQTGAGSQTLTLGGLTRNGRSSLSFSAGGTSPQASANKNMIIVTGAGTTTAGQIIGAWATTGTSPAVQTDYAVYNSDYITPFGATANNDETTWASSNNINFDAATTLTSTRTVNTLRYSGAAATLDLGSNVLETTGLLNGGTGLLTLTGSGSLTTPTGGGNLYATTGSNNVTIANPITDNGGAVSLVKSGTAAVTLANGNLSSQGALLLNGVNTYTGDTIINGGTLRIGGSTVPNGAKLGGAGGDYSGNIQINGGGLLWISSNANQILSGVISGDGALMKTYSGTLTLSGANTYTGRTSISPSQTSGAGTLEVSSFNSVNGGSPLLPSSSLGAPTTVANGTIDLGGPASVQGPATLRYTGSGETTDRVMNIRFGANTSRTIETNGSGLLKFNSPFTFENIGQASVTTIILQGTGNGEIVGGLPSAGGYAVTKNGAGTWTIGGPVGHSGVTTVGTGTLILNGSKPGPGAVNVNGTSTLGGNGTLGGNVTVAAGANLAPGASAGTLSMNGDLTISALAGGAGKLFYELGPIAASDKIAVAGTLTFGVDSLGLSDFDLTNLGGLENGNYVLISSGALNGGDSVDPADKDGTLGGGTTELKVIGNDIVLTVSGLAGGSPFDTWAGTGTLGPVTFDGDTNGDSVKDGLAFLLGVSNPDDSALDKLPAVTETGGGLVMTFTMLDSASRGTASLSVEHSSDLGISDAWTTVAVTDGNSGPTNGVTFVVSGSGTLNVVATIGSGEAAAGKLFGRLEGNQP